MREVKHITVAVSPELYRQTRKIAADLDSNVTALVAYILQTFPWRLKQAGYNVTVPPGPPPCRPATPQRSASPAPNPQKHSRVEPPQGSTPAIAAISGSETVKPAQTHDYS